MVVKGSTTESMVEGEMTDLLCIDLLLCDDRHILHASGGVPGLWWAVGGAWRLRDTPTFLPIKFTCNKIAIFVNTYM